MYYKCIYSPFYIMMSYSLPMKKAESKGKNAENSIQAKYYICVQIECLHRQGTSKLLDFHNNIELFLGITGTLIVSSKTNNWGLRLERNHIMA